MTWEHACELISWVLFGTTDRAKEVWEMSPSGELWPVAEMLESCESLLGFAGLGPRS